MAEDQPTNPGTGRPSKAGNQRRRGAKRANARARGGNATQTTANPHLADGDAINNDHQDVPFPLGSNADGPDGTSQVLAESVEHPASDNYQREPAQASRGRGNRRRQKRHNHVTADGIPDQTAEPSQVNLQDSTNHSPPLPTTANTNPAVVADVEVTSLPLHPRQDSTLRYNENEHSQAPRSPPTGPRTAPTGLPGNARRRQKWQKIPHAFPPEIPHAAENPSEIYGNIIGADAYSRPMPPQNRKIYDPNRHPGLPPPSRDTVISIPRQALYLDQVVNVQLENIETPHDELLHAETLRIGLQEMCRSAVTYLASETVPDFDPMTVKLRAFGSLRAGFSLKASDMDLALVSPQTEANLNFDDAEIPRLLEQLFLHRGLGARLLTRTRVPILKVCEKPTEELMTNLLIERLKYDDARAKEREAAAAKQNEATFDESSERKIDSQLVEKGPKNASPASPGEPDSPSPTDCHASKEVSEDEPKGMQNRSNEELVRLFALAIQEGWYSQEDRQLIADFNSCHELACGNADDPHLAKARHDLRRLPDVLSRYREPKDNHLDFPKTGVGIQCDINFSNPLALHNTSLLRCYNICDDRIRAMILFVKAWAKLRDINTPYKGTLSSYGYVLMVLHYVVNIASPPLAPNLQLQLGPGRGGAPGVETECNGYNVQFWRNEKQIKWAARHGQINYSHESLGSLLRGFFQYYAEQGHPNFVPRGGFGWTREVLSLRSDGGILTKDQKGWTGARTDTLEGSSGEKPVEIRQRYLLAIEDPFETDHNVARPVAHNGICAIRDEFRRANRIIKCGGVVDGQQQDLFAECKHAELDREQRFFGPMPSNTPRPKFSGPKLANSGVQPSGSTPVGVKGKGSRFSRTNGPRPKFTGPSPADLKEQGLGESWAANGSPEGSNFEVSPSHEGTFPPLPRQNGNQMQLSPGMSNGTN